MKHLVIFFFLSVFAFGNVQAQEYPTPSEEAEQLIKCLK